MSGKQKQPKQPKQPKAVEKKDPEQGSYQEHMAKWESKAEKVEASAEKISAVNSVDEQKADLEMHPKFSKFNKQGVNQ